MQTKQNNRLKEFFEDLFEDGLSTIWNITLIVIYVLLGLGILSLFGVSLQTLI